MCARTIVSSCQDCSALSDPVEKFLCAMDICVGEGVNSSSISSPSGDGVDDAFGVTSHFGDLSNDLAPKYGGSYGFAE